MVDQAEQRRSGGARDVLLGDVEQRRDRVEVAIGLRSGGPARVRWPPASAAADLTGARPPTACSEICSSSALRHAARRYRHARAAADSLIGGRALEPSRRLDQQIDEDHRDGCHSNAAQSASRFAQQHQIIDPPNNPAATHRKHQITIKPFTQMMSKRGQYPHTPLLGQRATTLDCPRGVRPELQRRPTEQEPARNTTQNTTRATPPVSDSDAPRVRTSSAQRDATAINTLQRAAMRQCAGDQTSILADAVGTRAASHTNLQANTHRIAATMTGGNNVVP